MPHFAVLLVVTLSGVGVLSAWDPLPVKDDPLLRMPGTQPTPEGSVLLEDPDGCTLCHGGPPGGDFPGFNWQGVDSPGYFTAAEYAGGYDEVSVT